MELFPDDFIFFDMNIMVRNDGDPFIEFLFKIFNCRHILFKHQVGHFGMNPQHDMAAVIFTGIVANLS